MSNGSIDMYSSSNAFNLVVHDKNKNSISNVLLIRLIDSICRVTLFDGYPEGVLP